MARKITPNNFEAFTLYRIYYGDDIVYVGRTMQPLQTRIHGHLFNKPMHRKIDIEQVTKVEYSTYKTKADMYLYEVYFINLYQPSLNRDDLAHDNLTVTLPDVTWTEFTTPLWDKWCEQIAAIKREEVTARQKEISYQEKKHLLREKLHNGEISEDEFWERLYTKGGVDTDALI